MNSEQASKNSQLCLIFLINVYLINVLFMNIYLIIMSFSNNLFIMTYMGLETTTFRLRGRQAEAATGGVL